MYKIFKPKGYNDKFAIWEIFFYKGELFGFNSSRVYWKTPINKLKYDTLLMNRNNYSNFDEGCVDLEDEDILGDGTSSYEYIMDILVERYDTDIEKKEFYETHKLAQFESFMRRELS